MEEKIYDTKKAKVIDFLIGFFILGGVLDFAVSIVLKTAGYAGMPAVLAGSALAAIALGLLLYQKRRYMGIGLLTLLALHLVSVSPFILMAMNR